MINAQSVKIISTSKSKYFFFNIAFFDNVIFIFTYIHFLNSYLIFNFKLKLILKYLINESMSGIFDIEEIFLIISIKIFAKNFKINVNKKIMGFAENFNDFKIFNKFFISILMIK